MGKLIVRDVASELDLWKYDFQEVALSKILAENGYIIITPEHIDFEYSDMKGYYNIEIKETEQ